jgi:protein-tyrosine-phosphatase
LPAILFVCSANQCRSPMAEALFQEHLEQMGVGGEWRVESAGVWAMVEAPAMALAREVMKERGLDISHHRSQGVSTELLREFDLILVMEDMHRKSLQRNFPEAADKVYLLTAMADQEGNVDDPVYGTKETYRATVEELESFLKQGFKRILDLANN